MPALDVCHPQVVRALEQAGWRVDPRPYQIRAPKRRNPLYADIFAEQANEGIIIAEVKCFQTNPLEELYTAIGQYLVYRSLLKRLQIDYPIYLAVPTDAYHGILKESVADVIQETNIKLLIVDVVNEVIDQWFR